MLSPPEMSFNRVVTHARVRGRPVSSWYSFPNGISVDRTREIDAALHRAYGEDSITIIS
jgi:hypothetical protein